LDAVVGTEAIRPYFDSHRIEWVGPDDDPSIEFNLAISEWFRLFRQTGFEVLDFHEIRAPEGIDDARFSVPAEWARRYPSEQAWVLRKER
jgi:hypothetical protein